MVTLSSTLSAINNTERVKINQNWDAISRRFSNLQGQLQLLSGGKDLDEIVNRIEQTITNAQNTTANTQQVLNQISAALVELETALSNVNALNANVQQAVDDLNLALNNMTYRGVYDNSVNYQKGNYVRLLKSTYVSLKQNVGIAPSDNGIDWRLVAVGGIDGTGAVSTVNNVQPNADGNVLLTSSDVGSISLERYTDLIINVKSHGVLGNNIADDTDAINALINSTTSGTIYFPKGEYRITRKSDRVLPFSQISRGVGVLLLNKSNINIVFSPDANIRMSVTDANVFNGFWLEGCEKVKIIGANFLGDGLTTTRILEDGVGISITGSKRCKVIGATAKNIRGCARAYNSQNIEIKDGFSQIYANQHVTGHFALYSSQDSLIDNCTSYGATEDGDIFIYGNDSINCTISNCESFAYVYEDQSKTIFYNEGHGILVDSGGRNCKMIDNYVYGYYYGFDSKNDSEGTVISGNTAEKCKVGISARKGEGMASPVNGLQVTNNIITPNGGNGNKNPLLGDITLDFGIALFDAYGGTLIKGNSIFNSIETNVESQTFDFIGVVIGISDNTTESFQGGFNISDNIFEFENRLGSSYGLNRAQAIFVTSQFRVNNLSIVNNKFDLPQSGILQNVIELRNVNGLIISDNNFSDVTGTAPYLMTLTNCSRIKVDHNRFGTHFGAAAFYNANTVSFSGNMSSENLNVPFRPTVLFDNSFYMKVNDNIQVNSTNSNTDGDYLTTVNNSDFLIAQSNILRLVNRDSSNWYSSTAVTRLVSNNLID